LILKFAIDFEIAFNKGFFGNVGKKSQYAHTPLSNSDLVLMIKLYNYK